MDPNAALPATVDEYIAGFPKNVQTVLRKVRRTVRSAAPQATEIISYRMPALRQHGVLIYYAAFQHHIGFYPPIRGNAALERAVARFAGPKGNLRFSLTEPIPYDLIRRLTEHRAAQDRARHPSRPAVSASAKSSPTTRGRRVTAEARTRSAQRR